MEILMLPGYFFPRKSERRAKYVEKKLGRRITAQIKHWFLHLMSTGDSAKVNDHLH